MTLCLNFPYQSVITETLEDTTEKYNEKERQLFFVILGCTSHHTYSKNFMHAWYNLQKSTIPASCPGCQSCCQSM